MKKVAVVGFGFMGRTHFGAWKSCPGAEVVAVCEADRAQLSRTVEGNIAGVADQAALPETVTVYDSFDRLLAGGGVDIVDLTVPTPLHERLAVRALEAGCHVLCEKPMALTLEACDRMTAAAARARRTLLVAQCVRFFPAYRALASFVRDGTYGRVIAADFSRVMSPPKWSPEGGSWLLDESQSGGLFVDAHIHDLDYISSLFGRPRAVASRAHRAGHGYTDHITTFLDYPQMLVTADASFAAADSLVFEAAARVFFEKATVVLGGNGAPPLRVYPNGGRPFEPALSALSGYEEEVRYFLSMVESPAGTVFPFTAADARESTALALAARRSAQTGRQISL